MVVPLSSIVERGEMTSVFVVGADKVSRLRWVKAGRRFETEIEILAGVNVGEQVLLEGARGADGAVVQIVETVAPPKQ